MFLSVPSPNEATTALYARDIVEDGYVSNVARLWAWRSDVLDAFSGLRNLLTEQAARSLRERAIVVCATAASLGEPCCALAWGSRLASESDPETASAVPRCSEPPALTACEPALAPWTRKVAREPNATTAKDVGALRTAGLTDQEIFDVTVFIAFRIACSTVSDALGARPDAQSAAIVPAAVRDAVVHGRLADEQPTT